MSEHEQKNSQGTESKFTYTYAAPTERERKEAESLRKQYELTPTAPKGKLERLRALDAKVQNPPKTLALTLGVIGTLIFGLGISMILEWSILLWGAVVAVAGVIPLAFAYPAYKHCLNRLKNKYREEILKLSNEILSGDNE